MTLEMHANDRIPLVLAHIGERPIAQDAGVVDENVEAPKLLQGEGHEICRLVPIRHVMAADGSSATESFDLANHLLCRRRVLSFPLKVAALVIDNDHSAVAGQSERVRPAKPPPRSRHDGNPTFKILPCSQRLGSRPFLVLEFSLRWKFSTMLILNAWFRQGGSSGTGPDFGSAHAEETGGISTSGRPFRKTGSAGSQCSTPSWQRVRSPAPPTHPTMSGPAFRPPVIRCAF